MLTDKFSRKLDYLRISVTDKCNLRCSYCMPAEGVKLLPHDEVLRNEEFIYFIQIFAGLGIKKIRFTGGEPLIRKGFIEILKKTRELFPFLELGVTTNGILLDEYVNELRKLKINKLNISLDTVSGEDYKSITGRDFSDRVMANIDRALSADCFDIKINTVLSDATERHLDGLLDFFKERKATLRFIEKMPFPAGEVSGKPMLSDGLVAALKRRGGLKRNADMDTRVALMYDLIYKGCGMKIGIIPPMTHNICAMCNRLRLTCDGFLKTCLHSNAEYDLKTPYRMDMGDEAIKDIILRAASEKPKGHTLKCDLSDSDGCSSLQGKRGMYRIGG
ncbi:MAG: GTP 3',8-cyclase MoaA [Spirochaetes bacterium]|jgi:cyclic pyranopterin phosphate synthase|nr:GTP 3',8-cyclase MoaA [Spirochaetota bacterium]